MEVQNKFSDAMDQRPRLRRVSSDVHVRLQESVAPSDVRRLQRKSVRFSQEQAAETEQPRQMPTVYFDPNRGWHR